MCQKETRAFDLLFLSDINNRQEYKDTESWRVNVVGVDVLPSSTTTHVGSVADAELITKLFVEFDGFDAVFHTGNLLIAYHHRVIE